MKKASSILMAVLLTTACAAHAAVIPVSAVSKDTFSEIVYADPIYPLEHTGDATLYVDAEEDMQCSIAVIQHSPERENLVLYSLDLSLKKGNATAFNLEPGDYTVRTTVKATKDGYAPLHAEENFVVENADYSGLTSFDIYEHITLNKNDETADSVQIESISQTTDDKEKEEKTMECLYQLRFAQYDRLRGDYDGNGLITLDDAREVLQYHVMQLTNIVPEKPPTQGQIVACDIDNNGVLGIEDVKMILDYSVATSIGLDYHWIS